MKKLKLYESFDPEKDFPTNEADDNMANAEEEATASTEEPAEEPAETGEEESAPKEDLGNSPEKGELISVHAFRYVGDGDGVVFSRERDEEKMNSDNWQYLGQHELPGELLTQLPRNEKKKEWRMVHKDKNNPKVDDAEKSEEEPEEEAPAEDTPEESSEEPKKEEGGDEEGGGDFSL